jgi:hypothetical protein
MMIRSSHSKVIEMCQTSFNGIQLLYQKNKDFLCLSKNDQTTLLHRTIKYIAAFSSNCISYHVGLLNYSSYYDTLELITHSIVIDADKHMEKHLDFDFIIMKLFLAIQIQQIILMKTFFIFMINNFLFLYDVKFFSINLKKMIDLTK